MPTSHQLRPGSRPIYQLTRRSRRCQGPLAPARWPPPRGRRQARHRILRHRYSRTSPLDMKPPSRGEERLLQSPRSNQKSPSGRSHSIEWRILVGSSEPTGSAARRAAPESNVRYGCINAGRPRSQPQDGVLFRTAESHTTVGPSGPRMRLRTMGLRQSVVERVGAFLVPTGRKRSAAERPGSTSCARGPQNDCRDAQRPYV